jgi:GT2 family glycosyltransferase
MSNGPLVAVVIVHWGSPEMTMECMESVLASEYRGLKIILVDNCPERPLWQQSSEINGTIEYMPAATNTGYCGGNNLGIGRARELGAEYVLLLNNDTIIDETLIHDCVGYMESRPTAAVISPKVFFHQDPQNIYIAGGRLDLNTGEIEFPGWNEKDVGQYEQEREITFAHGCALFARATVFERVGFFDERLFSYCEDSDLSRRIILAGMRMIYYPKARVWHKCSSLEDGRTGNVATPLATYYIWRNKFFNFRRYIVERRARGYCAFAYRFVWRFASFALKYRRFDLCRAMAVGLIDAAIGRMGKREYRFFGMPMVST